MIEVIQSVNELPALSAAWDELAPAVPMLLHEWILAAALAFHSLDELCIVMLRSENGGTQAIAPLVRTKGSVGQVLEIVGSRFLFEPSGFLHRDPAALKTLLSTVLHRKLPLHLDRLALNSDEVSAVSAACAQRTLYFERRGSSSPYTKLDPDWNAFEQRISSRRRSDLRRSMRHAEKTGRVEFEVLNVTPRTQAAAFAELLEIERESWKERNGTAISIDRRYETFFSKFVELASARGRIRIGFMRVDGRPIAFNLAVQHGGALWVLKIGYRESHSKCSPGVLLMHEMLRYACGEGLSRFEFLGAEESWLQLWSPETREYCNLKIFPLNLGSACEFGAVASGFLLGKMRRLLASQRREAGRP